MLGACRADRAGSDVDVLADFEPGSALFDVLGLAAEPAHLPGRHVDGEAAGD